MTKEIEQDYILQAMNAVIENNLEALESLVEKGLVNKDTIELETFIDLDGDFQKKSNPKSLFDIAVSLKRKDIVKFFLTYEKENES
jgi:hypothetical protein